MPRITLAGLPLTTVNGGTSWETKSAHASLHFTLRSPIRQTHPCHDRARSHGAPPLHRPPWQDRHVRADKAVLLNHNRLPQIRALTTEPLLRVDRHGRRQDAHIGPDHAAIADLDLRAVEDRAVAVDHDVLPDRDVVPVVAREGRGDHAALADVALAVDGRGEVRRDVGELLGLQDVAEETGPVFGEVAVVGVRAVVEAPAGGVAALALEDELAVEGEEVLAG